MNNQEQIIIKDSDGRVFLTINFQGPFKPETKFKAELLPKTKEELGKPKDLDFTFECSFDDTDLDFVPLTVMAARIATYPRLLEAMSDVLATNLILAKEGDVGQFTGKPPVKRPPSRLPSQSECEHKIALLVTGDCSYWPGSTVVMTEAAKDMRQLGYVTISLTTPTIATLEKALANPCVKALVIIGHGPKGDSKVGGTDMAAVALGNTQGIPLQPSHLSNLGVPNVPLELFILHSCYQGSPNNKIAWKKAAGGKACRFESWSKFLVPAAGITWQKAF